MNVLVTMSVFLALWAALCMGAMWWLRREEAKKQIKPPLAFNLMRLPGQSLMVQREDLIWEVMQDLLLTATVPAAAFVGPCLLGNALGLTQYLDLLIWAGIVLMLLSLMITWKRALTSGRELRSCKLGVAGERVVAEALQNLSVKGYYVFHDVPVTSEGKTVANLDHVAVGPHGVILIETKARGIDTSERLRASTVTFDGERLIWPRWGNDYGTVKQVRRGAAWLSGWIKENCGLDITIHQIIAIPGWNVTPGNFYNPRVVSAEAVASSFLHRYESKPPLLKPQEIKKVAGKLREMNRTENW